MDEKYTIHDYTEKSFVVTGDTKPIKDDLKAFKGKFGFWKVKQDGSYLPGWMFAKIHLEEVKRFLKAKN